MDKSSVTEELEALFDLLEKGAITKEEYEAQKALLLSNQDQQPINTNTSFPESAESQDESIPVFIEQPAQIQNQQSHSNSVKIILIIMIGIIILVAMFFIFFSNRANTSPVNDQSTLSASMASSVITVNAQQPSDTTSEADTDETGLNLNKKTPEELNKLLIKFQQERANAVANLRSVWAGLDPDFKATVQQEQKDWDSTALAANCSLSGYSTPLAQQVANQYCETMMLNSRAQNLLDEQASSLADIKQEKTAQMDKMATDALKRVNLTWSTIPEDIQQNLNQTFEQWSDEVNQYCLSRPTAQNLTETQINYDNCVIKKSESKIKELNGYKI